MTMKKHLNIFIPDDLLAELDAFAIEQGINRSQAARLVLSQGLVDHEVYTPPALPNWRTESWTLLLHRLFNDERLALTDKIEALLAEAVAALDERGARVLRLRFGLEGPRHTLEGVGVIFGIKRSRVHQVEGKALLQMRYWLRNSGIWGLLEGQLNEEKA